MDAEGSDGGPETSRSLVMLGCEVGVRSAGLKAIYSIVMLVGCSIGWCVCISTWHMDLISGHEYFVCWTICPGRQGWFNAAWRLLGGWNKGRFKIIS